MYYYFVGKSSETAPIDDVTCNMKLMRLKLFNLLLLLDI